MQIRLLVDFSTLRDSVSRIGSSLKPTADFDWDNTEQDFGAINQQQKIKHLSC